MPARTHGCGMAPRIPVRANEVLINKPLVHLAFSTKMYLFFVNLQTYEAVVVVVAATAVSLMP